MILRPLPLLVAFLVLVVSGVVHGICTQRWQTSEALSDAANRLPTVPHAIGGWKGVDVEVDPAPYHQARAAGWWVRRYSKEGVDGSITVILMCGRAGHMAVHTPDVCYRGAGFEMAGEPTVYDCVWLTAAPSAQLWTARFRQPARSGGQELAIYWSWSADGLWQAPGSPRLAFGGRELLFKLYVVREIRGDSAADEVTPEFLRQLLPRLNQTLFSASAGAP